MHVELDGALLKGAGSTLGSALDAARAACAGPGQRPSRLVVEVSADGSAVSPEELSEPPTRAPYCARLSIKTADARELVRDSLLDASSLVRELTPRHAEAAELIQASRTGEAMDELSRLLSGWEQARHTVQIARSFVEGSPLAAEQAAVHAIGELASRLTEIKRSLTTQDWSSLADTLAYDMPSLGEKWSAMLGEMAVALASKSASSSVRPEVIP